MRVLVDAYWWISGPPSGRNVLRELVFAWSDEWPDDQLTLVVPADATAAVENSLRLKGVGAAVVEAPRWARMHALSLFSRHYRSTDFDIVLTQNFGAWRVKAISTTFVHDVIFMAHPEWFTVRERAYLSLIYPSLRSVQRVFTSSNSEMTRIAETWPKLKGRIHAVGLAAPSELVGADTRQVRDFGAEKPFLLTVARFNVRKNLGPLLDAFASSPLRETHDFVVVGPADGKLPVLPESVTAITGKTIHLLGQVDVEELRWLYENTCLFVLASLDEGFGLPLVEAAGFGTPITASDIPVFQEIGVTHVSFDPESVHSIRRALVEGSQSANTGRVPPVAHAYSWRKTVQKMRSKVQSE